MTTLGEKLDEFLTDVEALEAADAGLPARLQGLVMRLARDAVEHVAEYGMGEIPALVQRSHEVLATLADDDPHDRRSRHRRRAAVLNLCVLADAVQSHHAGSRAQQRSTIDDMRERIAEALSGVAAIDGD